MINQKSKIPGLAERSGAGKNQNLNLKLKNFLVLILVLIFALCTLHLNIVQAQTISLSIWPPLLEVQMIPGKTVVQKYQLTNNSDKTLFVRGQIYPFEPLDNEGRIKINFKQTAATDPSPYFFSFEKPLQIGKGFEIGPKESKNIGLRISLPKNSAQKDYYFTLLFSTSEAGNEKTQHSASITQIGTNILLSSSVTETLPAAGKIVQFAIPKIIDSFSKLNINLTLENSGQYLFKSFGSIKIEGMLKQKREISLLPQNILAGSERKLDIPEIKLALPIGPFRLETEIHLNNAKTGPLLYSQTVFWYLPWKLAIGVSTVIIIFTILKKLRKSADSRLR